MRALGDVAWRVAWRGRVRGDGRVWSPVGTRVWWRVANQTNNPGLLPHSEE